MKRLEADGGELNQRGPDLEVENWRSSDLSEVFE